VFYYSSKILWFIFQPSSLIALMMLAGLVMRTSRHGQAAQRLLWTGTTLLFLLGLSPIGGALLLPLEDRFPRPDLSKTGTRVDGIIVLGGAEDPRTGSVRGVVAFNEAAERLVEAVELAQRFPNAKLVFSGGSSEILTSKPAEAWAAAQLFTELGIPAARLEVEPNSRNTSENANFTRELVKPKPGEHWLLVTSAFHMPRAMGCFRKAGFAVEAFPVDYRTPGPEEMLHPFSSIPEGLRRVDLVFKEYVGLVSYYLSGRTDALFPAPVAAAGSIVGSIAAPQT
jgi:uncharacterized SAM-binding protein YcdF (DUF218 family)